MQKQHKIIALHGAGMTAGAFGTLATYLTDYAFQPMTLPGHSALQDAAALSDIAAMGQWVKQRLEGEEQKSIILLGHSMGGLVALAASDHPAIAGVAVMGAAALMPVHAGLLEMAKEVPDEAKGLIIKWGIDPAHLQAEEVCLSLRALMDSVPFGTLYKDLSACDTAPAAKLLQDVPFLVLVGEQDRMVKAEKSIALSDENNGVFVLIENCGHMMMLERADVCAREIKEFAKDVWR